MTKRCCLIILTGYPGAGKSALGPRLSEKIKFPLFTKSSVLQSLNFSSALESNQKVINSVKACLLESLKAYLEKGKNCLISYQNGNHHYMKKGRFELFQAAKENSARIIYIDLVADSETLRERIEKRHLVEEGYKSINDSNWMLDKNSFYDPILDLNTIFKDCMSFFRFDTAKGEFSDEITLPGDESIVKEIQKNLQEAKKEEDKLFIERTT
jgi:deoxyadenosine/deoxycytidine kinase